MKQMTKLGEWLKSCDGMVEIKTGKLTLDSKVYEAAWYKQKRTPPAGARDPKPYVVECIYAIGEREKKFTRGGWALTMSGDAREWFFSAFILEENLTESSRRFAPFGSAFMLALWTSSESIDQYEKRPNVRVCAEFTPDIAMEAHHVKV